MQHHTSLVIDSLALPVLRARVSMRLLRATTLPPYKGGLLRGGFGYAFQRTCCPSSCWHNADACPVRDRCPYQQIFSPQHPTGAGTLHDLRDVPRPFVIEPPLDHKREYAPGDALEFGLVVMGRAAEYLPYFLHSFRELGQMGLGRDQAKARLERVEVLECWQPIGAPIYQDERALDVTTSAERYSYTGAMFAAQARRLPADLRLTLHTPLRIKARGDLLRTIDLPVLIQNLCWRLSTLATFYGAGAWNGDYRALVEQARQATVENQHVQWVDWERTSTRGPEPRKMTLGGLIGTATLRNVSPDVRAVLLAGTLVHIGKACVFGHGKYDLTSEKR